MVVVLALFAVKVSSKLAATTVATADGYAAARQVASRRVDHTDRRAVAVARSQAAAWFSQRVARYGTVEVLRIAVIDGTVHVRFAIRVRRVASPLAAVGADRIQRDLVVAVEEAR